MKYSFEESRAFVHTFDLPAQKKGPLDGLSFAVKDTFAVAGYAPSNGHPMWAKAQLSPVANAIAVDQLLYAGAKCLGITTSVELTFGLDGENPLCGTPLNPKAPNRVPGGSSSGSASAVACGLVDFALGTDNSGSVRVPASHTGIWGMRPTVGAISTSGLIPFAPTFDDIGVLANTAPLLTKVMHVLLAQKQAVDLPLKKIYLVKECFALADSEVRAGLEPSVNAIQKLYPSLFEEISLHKIFGNDMPQIKTWYDAIIKHVQWPEIINSVGGWIKAVNPVLSPGIRASIEEAMQLDRATIQKALTTIHHYADLLYNFLKPGSLLLFPTTPTIAPLKGALDDAAIGEDYYSRALGMSGISTVTHSPEVSMPVSLIKEAPIGLSLLAAKGNDLFLLKVVNDIVKKLTF